MEKEGVLRKEKTEHWINGSQGKIKLPGGKVETRDLGRGQGSPVGRGVRIGSGESWDREERAGEGDGRASRKRIWGRPMGGWGGGGEGCGKHKRRPRRERRGSPGRGYIVRPRRDTRILGERQNSREC